MRQALTTSTNVQPASPRAGLGQDVTPLEPPSVRSPF